MSPPRPDDFPEFFRALHGRDPFPWQRRLAARVVDGDWPETLALPTASGKTACIDVAVFALACQADRRTRERTAPRRILFIVDRRIIVDAAHERAKAIAQKLRSGLSIDEEPSPVLARVADALRRVGGLGGDEAPLVCSQLRGGIYRDQAWARTPTQPTVIASTVDQVGSRLLFRGYGVSDSLRPVHAALAGNDALILLDEAHCARPFLQTARAVADYRRLVAPGTPGPPPFRVAVLSATPPEDPGDAGGPPDVFALDEEDRLPQHLGLRLSAGKPAELIEPVPDKGKNFARALAAHARRLAGTGAPRAVVIFANRVQTARDIFEVLSDVPDSNAVLMTGRMRPVDRDDVIRKWGCYLRSGADRSKLDRAVFVVSTQCLEVGADFDFDALVTECASLDALRQRFGRLNRLGRPIDARAAILVRADQARADAKPDPIYGEALARTWRWLSAQAEPSGGHPVLDFGIDALATRLPDAPAPLGELNAPAPDAAVLLPTHLDYLVQTAPCPDPDPDPAIFLHGPGLGRPEVQACWRADLNFDTEGDLESQAAHWRDVVSLCPPVVSECAPVPLHIARAWLSEAREAPPAEADLESAPVVEPGDERREYRPRVALLWRGPDDPETGLARPGSLRPGDTLVIPINFSNRADLGTELGHLDIGTEPARDTPAWEPWAASLDVAERARAGTGKLAVLRVHPRLISNWRMPADGELRGLLGRPMDDLAEWGEDAIRSALRSLAEPNGDAIWLSEVARVLASDRRLRVIPYPHQAGDSAAATEGFVLLGSARLQTNHIEATDSATTEDDTASAGDGPLPLVVHTRDVVQQVALYARACDLPAPLAKALETAALLHDLGKADRRFQTLLQGGNALAAAMAPWLLAKSHRGTLPPGQAERSRERKRSGFPEGGRHELLSTRLATRLLDGLDPAVDRDLVLHLIASHHGHARPLFPFAEGLEPGQFPTDGAHRRQLDGLVGRPIEPMAGGTEPPLHRLGGGVPGRFWEFTRRYGWWGLAWLEAVLRLADHRASESPTGPEDHP